MTLYYLHEANVEVPDGWSDFSTNIFVREGDAPGSRVTLMFSRDRNPPADGDLEGYSNSQLVQLQGTLPSFRRLGSQEVNVNNERARQVDYEWRSPAGIDVHVRQVFVLTGKVVLIVSLTANTAHFPQHEDMWRHVLESLVLRELDS